MSQTSLDHLAQYEVLHSSQRYGVSGNKFAPHLQLCILELRPRIILDYGCGQTDFTGKLDVFGGTFLRYDPAIPAISKLPCAQADLVINTDVLEHIPEEAIDPFVDGIRQLSGNVFFSIATAPAKEVLPNGQNAHCSVHPPEAWLARLRRHFPAAEMLNISRRNSALILTWRSRVRGMIELVDEHYFYRRRSRKTLLGRLVYGGR